MKSFKQTLKEDIQPGYAPDEVTFDGYTTKNLHHSEDAVKAFMSTIDKVNKGEIKDREGVLHALKATDTYMKLNDMHLEQGKAPDEAEVEQWKAAHVEARRHLHAIGEFMHHMDYWHMHEHELQDELTAYNPETAGAEMADSYEPQGNQLDEELTSKTIRPTDKVKVARVIANMLDVENVESMSPETAINLGLRKIRHKRMTPELITVLTKMLNLAQMVGVKVDMNLLPHAMKQEKQEPIAEVTQSSAWPNKGENETDILRLKDYIALDRAAHGQVGHSMHSSPSGEDNKDHVRRMKVKYKTESTDLQEVTAGQHKVTVTVSEPDHPMVTKRKEQVMKRVIVNADNKDHAVVKAKEFYKKKGYKVHDAEYHSPQPKSTMKTEEVEASADYKTDKRGRKHPAHEIVFRDGGEDGSDKKDVKEELDDAKDATKKAALTLRHAREKESMAARHEVQKKSVTEEADGLDDSEAEILDLSDDEVDNFVTYDNLLDVLDDDEVDYIDLDTGEPIEDDESVNESTLNEVLSRTERMKAKVRFMRTQSKRERRVAIALKRRSDAKTINKRSRRLAIKLMKQKLIKKPVADMSVAEKERVERMIQQRKSMIDRLAMRMAPKVRRMETDRLGGHKGAAPKVGV